MHITHIKSINARYESDFWEAWNDWKESDHDVYPTIASYMMEEVEA